MRQRSEATTATDFRAPHSRQRLLSRLVQPAPGPEAPDAHDKAGRMTGMLLILVAGGGFWLAVAALTAYLLR